MRRGWHVRWLLGILVVCLVLTACGGNAETDLSGLVAPPPAQASRTPAQQDVPVILISIDTLRADHLGSYGYEQPTSPRLDQFRRDGVLFEQAIAQAPSTLPSHASMLTSLWPVHHGAFFMRRHALPEPMLTLTEILRDLGYRTAGFNGGGQMAPEFGLGQGFERYEVVPPQDGTLETVMLAESWIEELADEPFFLFLHTFEVHHPYTPDEATLRRFAPDYRGSLPPRIGKELLNRINRGQREIDAQDLAYIVAAYDAEIHSMDAALGRFFDFLRQRQLYDRSLIIVTSDHGEEFGERGTVGWHSHTLFDELLEVPLIIKLPGSRAAGTSVSAQVRSIDIAPTVLGVLGQTMPPEFSGYDLAALIEQPELDPGLPAISQQDTGLGIDHTALRMKTWKLYPNRLFHKHRLGRDAGSLATLRARMAWRMSRDRLYDIHGDAGEIDDLSRREKGVRQRLQELRAEMLAARPVPTPTSQDLDPATLEQLRALGYIED